jgi:septal ring factor EnvC (AmiA/AmiB activator)
MKIERIEQEIAKVKEKISEFQTLLRGLEQKKTEAENLEIVAIVRSLNIPRTELATVLSALKRGRGFTAAPVRPGQTDAE